jgi:hypothetical protein
MLVAQCGYKVNLLMVQAVTCCCNSLGSSAGVSAIFPKIGSCWISPWTGR